MIVGVRLVTPARATPSLSEFVAVDLVEMEPKAATDRTRDAPSPKAAAPAPEWRPDKVEQAQAQPVQTTEERGQGRQEETVELDTEFPFNYYLTIVRNKIIQLASPRIPCRTRDGADETPLRDTARRAGQQGGRRGDLGVSFFDQSALRAIYASAPLPPLPEEFPDAEAWRAFLL